ncbi:MAG: Na/Pi cotransporter family protein [Peptococcaceae bacterium]|nr:Na/Pi cotransporter family protein [Peptococcaceae bacterium]
MISFSMVMQFLGGIGLFLYGVNVTSEGLQKIAANKLKSILESLTKNTWAATLFGIAMTVALQSSAATTVMVVEFVNSGLMTLVQALGVALGSAVGTSIVIQLISFPILNLALFLIFIGFIFMLIVRTPFSKRCGQAMIGFGCIFVGMAYLSGAFAPLKNSAEVYLFLAQFGAKPALGILVSVLITALIQSSAAFLAILISLSTQGLLSIEAIVPLVMGAHIGGTLTTLISSLGAERIDAKRLAIANSFYRIAAAVIIFPFFSYFTKLVVFFGGDLPRQVANTHLFSAVLMVVIFLPINGFLAKALIRFVPQRKGKEQELQPKYITKGALEVPTVALTQARQEIRWLGYKILHNMLEIMPRVFAAGDSRWLSELEKAEQQVDWYYAQLSNYLLALFRKNMTRKQIMENHRFQLITKELEYIADSLIVMARLGHKVNQEKGIIEESDWNGLEELYIAVSENYLALMRVFDRWQPDCAYAVMESHKKIIDVFNLLQGNMVCRIQSVSPGTDSMAEEEKDWKENLSEGQKAVLELGNWFYKIGEHIVSIAKVFGTASDEILVD